MPESSQVYDNPECGPTRREIEDTGEFFGNLEFVPQPEDSDYDEQQLHLSRIMQAAKDAFDNRPKGCEMTSDGQGTYNCARCDFWVEV